jgi:hypothetical protein
MKARSAALQTETIRAHSALARSRKLESHAAPPHECLDQNQARYGMGLVFEDRLERPIHRQRFMNMNYRASACRKKALQCERAAKIATDADARRVYLDVARQWRDRAQHTEELERHTSASRTESNASQQSIADKQSFVSTSSRRLTP